MNKNTAKHIISNIVRSVRNLRPDFVNMDDIDIALNLLNEYNVVSDQVVADQITNEWFDTLESIYAED